MIGYALAILWIRLVLWRGPSRMGVTGMMGAAFIAVVLSQPQLLVAARMGYPGDSFWTLCTFGRAGVIAISTLGLVGFFYLLTAKTGWLMQQQIARPILIPCDILIGFVAYIALDRLAPQAFYSFYQLIFPDLPHQIVVIDLPDLSDIKRLALFHEDPSMAGHLRAIGFWAILPFTILLQSHILIRQGSDHT